MKEVVGQSSDCSAVRLPRGEPWDDTREGDVKDEELASSYPPCTEHHKGRCAAPINVFTAFAKALDALIYYGILRASNRHRCRQRGALDDVAGPPKHWIDQLQENLAEACVLLDQSRKDIPVDKAVRNGMWRQEGQQLQQLHESSISTAAAAKNVPSSLNKKA